MFTVSRSALVLLLLSPVQFNNAISKTTKDLEAAGRKFGESLVSEKDAGKLKAAHADVAARTRAIVAQARKIKAPEGKEAQEMWNAFEAYLATEEKMIGAGFKDIVDIMTSPNPDQNKIVQIFQQMQADEGRVVSRLRAAQAAFAKVNGFEIR